MQCRNGLNWEESLGGCALPMLGDTFKATAMKAPKSKILRSVPSVCPSTVVALPSDAKLPVEGKFPRLQPLVSSASEQMCSFALLPYLSSEGQDCQLIV